MQTSPAKQQEKLVESLSSAMLPGGGTSLVAQLVKNPPAMQETWVPSLGWEDSLEKGKATHSGLLAWRIPWTVGVAKGQIRLNAFHSLTGYLGPKPICPESPHWWHLMWWPNVHWKHRSQRNGLTLKLKTLKQMFNWGNSEWPLARWECTVHLFSLQPPPHHSNPQGHGQPHEVL